MIVTDASERFVRHALYVGAGLLIWVAQFLGGYLIVALACARGFAERRMAGISVTTIVTLAIGLCAASACAGLLQHALSRSRTTPATEETERFIHFIAGAVAALSLAAIGWTAIASAVPPQCR